MGNDSEKEAAPPPQQMQRQQAGQMMMPQNPYNYGGNNSQMAPGNYNNPAGGPGSPDGMSIASVKEQKPFDYPPYVLMGAHYNQQLVAQQQYAMGYPQRGALSSIPTGDYAKQVQDYYRNLYAQTGQQQPLLPGQPGYYYGQNGQPMPLPNGMTMNGGVPIGDGSMVMYETADPYDDPLQQPHWHRRNRPESGYVVNIVRMNPGGTLQERPNQF